MYPGIGAIKLLILSDFRYVKLKKKRLGGERWCCEEE